jgi:predicted metal-dependent peptidase
VTREEMKTDMESFDYISYLYGLAHYGNLPLIEHLEYQEVHKLEELVIAIDTSGSCKSETIRRFMEETYGILSDRENFFDRMNVYVIQADFCVQDVAHITSEAEWNTYLDHLAVHGRSGTDFRPVFAYVEQLREKKELKDLRGLLYFTDGDGIYPEHPTDYETAFVFYQEKEYHQKVPSWAVKLELEGEQDEH